MPKNDTSISTCYEHADAHWNFTYLKQSMPAIFASISTITVNIDNKIL